MSQAQTAAPIRRFTGWHMSAILIAFFGVVIVVNVWMASLASSTFSGEVIENGYVASQQFNHWLDEAAKEQALGWKANLSREADQRLAVTVTGPGTEQAVLSADAWRPLGKAQTLTLTFRRIAPGSYVSEQPVPRGRWRLRLALTAGGKQWRSVEDI